MEGSLNKRLELAKAVMKEMEKEGFSRGEAESFPRLLDSLIKQNNEQFRREKPFVVYSGQR